jgi:uncharacterized membrane protein YkvA (DUF1232 family)
MRWIIGVASTVILAWLVLVALIALRRPDDMTARDVLRLLPDTIRLARRLAGDRRIPARARAEAWLLVAYLAVPIDLVPDFLPVVGQLDDVVLILVVLRRLVRRAGAAVVDEQWPGSPEGLIALRRVLRLA